MRVVWAKRMVEPMNQKQPMFTWCVVGVLFATALASETTCVAQNALGGGNALDSNLSAIGGKYNAPAPVHDFRLANNIITGNVAGGRGFQGFVGYTAQNDFFGHLPTNDLFSFRADSAYSNPEVFSLGSAYNTMRFGLNLGQLEPIRSGVGSTGADLVSAGSYNEMQQNLARVRLDRSIILSTTVATTEATVEPTTVGVGKDRDTGLPLLMQASPLRGLTTTLSQDSFGTIGLTMYDQARAQKDLALGQATGKPGSPFETRFEALAVDTRIDDGLGKSDAKVLTDVNAEYRKMLDNITKRFATEHHIDLTTNPDGVKSLDQEYQQLRERLMGERAKGTDRSGAKVDTRVSTEITGAQQPAAPPDKKTGFEPGAEAPNPPAPKPGHEDLTSLPTNDPLTGVTTRVPKPFTGGDIAPPTVDEPKEPEPFNPDVYAPMLRHGQTMPSLAAKDQSRMSELISSAEQRLHDGDYFSAERRFERALRYVPGHPMATAGIAHAQIGAGLYLSASLSLRNLFANHPEMIDVTYGENALPPRQRLNDVVSVLKKYANDPVNDPAGYGFLLAYLGRQLGDKALIELGLKTFAEADPAGALPTLLRSVWLGHDDAAMPAAPASMPQPEK